MNLTEWIDATLAEADRAAEEKRRKEAEEQQQKVQNTTNRLLSILSDWGCPLGDVTNCLSPEGGLCIEDAVLLPYGAEQIRNHQAAINCCQNGHSHWCYNKEEFAAWLRSHLQHIKGEGFVNS